MTGHPYGFQEGRSNLIITAQNITTGWVDLGSVVDTVGVETLGIWLVVDNNGAANVRIRALAAHTAAGTEYTLPIRTVSSTDVKISAEYMELASDTDQNMLLSVTLKNIVPMVQIQVMATTAGTGQIDEAVTTKGY